MAIKDLSVNAVLHDDDRFPIYDIESGRTRSVLASTLLKYIDDHPLHDKFVQRGVYNNGTLTLYYNDGGSFDIAGFDAGGGAVDSVNGHTGVVNLTADDVSAETKRASGTVGQADDPTTMAQGDYYVTEKFVSAPTLPGGISYVGLLRIDDDFDGSNNGGLIAYYTDNGIYLKKKLTSGWESSWELPLKHGLQSFDVIATTTDPFIGENSVVTLSAGNPYPPDAVIPDGIKYEFTKPDSTVPLASLAGDKITFHGIGGFFVKATTPDGLTMTSDMIRSITAPMESFDIGVFKKTSHWASGHTGEVSELRIDDWVMLDLTNVVPSNAFQGTVYYYLTAQDEGVTTFHLGNNNPTFQVKKVGSFTVKAVAEDYGLTVTKTFTTQAKSSAPPQPDPIQSIEGRVQNLEDTKLDDLGFNPVVATKKIEVDLSANGKVVKSEDIDLSTWFAGRVAPTLALQFSGIYDTLQNLKDAIPTPTENQQAIVIQPSEKYYHGVGGSWVELAPVGSFHPNYLGAYDTVDDLKAAVPSPADESLAIVGTTAKSFYFYTNSDWEQLTHTDLPSLDARVTDTETKTKSNTDRIQVAEGHLQTLQSNDQRHDTELSGIGDDIRQLQGQVYSGNKIQDDSGTTLNDITGLKFIGAQVEDDNGDQTATVTVSPKITVANGQQPGSTSATGNALIFEGATITPDPNDTSVIKVDSPHGGINVGDGANASREVTTLLFPGHQAYGSGNSAEIHLEFAHFKTIAERDAWTAKFATHMDYDVVCLVDADENGFVSWYKFNAATKQWSEYDAQGVVMSDSTGSAIPKNIKTVVFGPGFSLQQAGDQEDAALVTYAGESGIDGINFEMVGGQNNKASTLKIYPPLEAYADPDEQDTARLLVKPGTYEPMHKPSFLAYIDETIEVAGKANDVIDAKAHHDGALWFGDIVWPAGTYIQTDKPNKTYGLQEADELDPNVSGGTDYLVAFRVHMRGKAPNDGFVRAYLYDRQVNPFSESGMLKDRNGSIMGMQKFYKAGQDLGTIEVVGVVNAKGLKEFTCHVLDNFMDDMVTITDRTEGASGLMIQAITSEGKTGDGLQQFEIDTQQNIEFSSHYLGVDRASLDWITSRTMPDQTGNAGAGMTMADGWHFYNASQMKIGISNGHMHFYDNGIDTCDFNFGRIFSSEETQMLRGHDIKVSCTLVDKQNAFYVALMKWTGKPDEYSPEIFTNRNNTLPVFQTGWEQVSDIFISEDVILGDHNVSKTFTIPEDANNYAVIIYPQAAQIPIDLKLKQLKIDVEPAFIGYAIKAPELVGESHLIYNDQFKEFLQDQQGYSSLRYTINSSPTPMPSGIPGKGAADISLDTSIHQISGSSAKGGEGAINFQNDGEATVSSTYTVYAGENAAVGQTVNVKFWWSTYNPATQQYTQIPESVFDVKVTRSNEIPGTPTKVTTPSFTIAVEQNTKIAAFAQTSIDDGAFVMASSGANPVVQTAIEFKEIDAKDSSDTTDLINAPIDKKLVVDRRVYDFTNNSNQNITINVDIPDDVELAHIDVVKHSGTVTTSINTAEYSYDSSTNTLTVHVGSNAVNGKVYLTFWG